MNNKLIASLTVICLLLIAIITLEWLYATQAREQLLNSINAPTKQVAAEEMPAVDLNAEPEESYADLVNRPLFIAGRKPAPDTESEQIATVSNTFDWRLSGIYTSKQGLMALLTRTVIKPPDSTTGKKANDNYKKVIVGGEVDGWKVAEIHAADIILTQGTTEKKLPLRLPRTKKTPEKNGARPTPVPVPAPELAPETISEPTPDPEPVPTPEVTPAPQVEPNL